MDTNLRHFGRVAFTRLVALASCVALVIAPMAVAQAPAASGNAAEAPSPEELDKLVGPIALYPDDLVAIILPASTNPLQLVQADRFLQRRKSDPKLAIDDTWDDSVKSLVNYPDIVTKMSADLDWTAALGEAVVADQGAVLDAVQAFRRKAQSAGNLKTDAKQVVVVEKEIIKIEPADPQVIYVPQYNPATVVVYSPAPVYGYYPAPYPSYYYPYAPGAALATGLIWGAAIGAAWGGNRYGTNWSGGNNNITVNRNTNINTGDINRGNRPSQQPSRGGGSTAWQSGKKPGQVSSGAGRSATTARAGEGRPGGGGAGGGGVGGGAGGARPSQTGGGMGQGGGASRAGGASASGAATRSGGDAFGGYGSGNGARADSSRGASSRSSMSSQGGGRSSAGAGARGGGGGGRGGGGGGRGGGGRR
jgi:Protein of unknown function (DUF3300)